jgi:hypothetical protein
VTVEGTTITAEVGADGAFVQRGVPAGSFTLVFKADGTEIGRVPIEAPDGSATPSACVINGGQKGRGIELEGTVSSGSWDLFNMTVNGGRAGGLATVSAAAAAYQCVAGAKTDTVDACKALVARGGAKVHVRGTLMDCTADEAQVTATEVKIQKD